MDELFCYTIWLVVKTQSDEVSDDDWIKWRLFCYTIWLVAIVKYSVTTRTQELSPKSPRIGTVPEASGHGTPSLTSPSAITIHRKELGPKNDPTGPSQSC
ncbi:hypothetical protein J6590_067360 [Homalodisca vitripennis]|nr:hypothetical protein J6590_067360 [Homalodisca vitripennis]